MNLKSLGRALVVSALGLGVVSSAHAQVPPAIEAELKKIGQIVDPECTAKLYRPLMPKSDYNTYWPPDAASPVSTGQLYPGITITRDHSFGANPKDLIDIFVADKGSANRPVLIFVPGGAGNKIEQQVREGNAFYDNIARWATKNGMVGVLVQRHPGANWDDGGRDLSMAVDWLHDNVAKFKGDPNRMFIWAHSAGNGPLGVYVGHPERWKNGVRVKGAIFMSGNPVPTIVPPGAGGGAPPFGAPGGPQRGATCGVPPEALTSGVGGIAGPSGVARAGGAGAAGAGAPGGRGRAALTPQEQAERDNLPGFKKSTARIMLIRAELDPGVMGDMTAADKALHDALCMVDGPNAKDGTGHCPAMLFAKTESHMSEVFSIDTNDKIVSGPVLAWIKQTK